MALAESSCEVLVAGAGPTGLVLALWLNRLGVKVRIVDRLPAAAPYSRALGVQARTLEFYAQMDLAASVVAAGRQVEAANLWVAGRRVAHAPLGPMGTGISPFPYVLIYPQDAHERLLEDRLRAAGVAVDRGVELAAFSETADGIAAELRHAGGRVETCAARYLAGCDGAHSRVREGLGAAFDGGAYAHLFYVADVDGSGEAMNGELQVGLDRDDFMAIFPLPGSGRARLVGTVRPDAGRAGVPLAWEDVNQRVRAWMPVEVARVNWFSTYHVHHRVAQSFCGGGAFLLGDAAHVHSPVGAQGMNTGIGDAVNLAWKLAAVLHGGAAPWLLDTFDTERRAFARELVETTDRIFAAATSDRLLARFTRMELLPHLLAPVLSQTPTRRALFRRVSQTAINYRGSRLSVGRTGRLAAGDRLPWTGGVSGVDNFAPLHALAWQAHVYGGAGASWRRRCAELGLPLHEFAWAPAIAATGLVQDALYLIRPDGYIGLAEPAAATDSLAAYWAALSAASPMPI